MGNIWFEFICCCRGCNGIFTRGKFAFCRITGDSLSFFVYRFTCKCILINIRQHVISWVCRCYWLLGYDCNILITTSRNTVNTGYNRSQISYSNLNFIFTLFFVIYSKYKVSTICNRFFVYHCTIFQ